MKTDGNPVCNNAKNSFAKRILPRHVAVIMDGNGRWAKRRLLPRVAGHRAGLKSARKIIRLSGEMGIEILTLFAFSTENWRRPAQEVNALMDLFLTSLRKEAKKLQENNVQLRFIGQINDFDQKLKQQMRQVEFDTQANTGLKLVIAANYGGRWDIVQAAKQLALRVQKGELAIQDIDETVLSSEIALGDLPDPDLFIRTSGEQRISNFLNWQLAYTEMFFTDVYWPDFDETLFQQALDFYANRTRRFGLTDEQVQ